MIIHDIRPEVRQAIEDSIREVLHEYELVSYTIEPKEDASGDEAIFVDLYHRPDLQFLDARATGKLRDTLSKRLLELREYRFPYTSHHIRRAESSKR